MNKKTFQIAAILIISCMLITSCSLMQSDYQRGFEDGQKSTIKRIFDANCLVEDISLKSGETWDTNYFTLQLFDKKKNDSRELFYDFTVKVDQIHGVYDDEIPHGFNFESIFFEVIGVEETDEPYYKSILTGTDFYTNATSVSEHNVKGSIGGMDNEYCIWFTIIIDGNLYYGVYDFRTL